MCLLILCMFRISRKLTSYYSIPYYLSNIDAQIAFHCIYTHTHMFIILPDFAENDTSYII